MDTRLPAPFCYYRIISNTDHFPFGFWREDNSVMSLEDAQENMFNYVSSFLPPPPAEVLLVGYGPGLSAALLSKKGYRVTAIASSSGIIQYAQQRYGGSGVTFKALGFFDEDEVLSERDGYDVLFFEGFAQFAALLNELMKKARLLLKQNGFLIIHDEVCYDESAKPDASFPLSTELIVSLCEHGFRITENKKMGKQVFPSYDLVIRGLKNKREKIITECAEEDARAGLDSCIRRWEKKKAWNMEGKMGYEIFVARKDDFSIVPYSAGDEVRILPVFNEVFGVSRTLDHWYWKFRDNPHGAYNISEVFSKEGGLVAHYAGYPVPFYCDVNGEPETFLSFQIGDTMTRPEVRQVGRGKTSLLARTAHHFYARYCGGKVPFTFGFNTGTIKKFGERFLGYQYLGPIPYRIKRVKGAPRQRGSFLRGIFSRYTVRTIDTFEEAFDDFFERTAPAYKLLAKRGSRYLTWRYGDCPDKDYAMVSVHSKRGMVGWSIFFKKGANLIWGDALFDREHPGAVEFLLDYLCSSPLGKDVETIEGWFSVNPVWWNSTLDQLGFESAHEPNDLFPGFYILSDDDWMERLGKFLYYTMGDSDLF